MIVVFNFYKITVYKYDWYPFIIDCGITITCPILNLDSGQIGKGLL